MATTASFAFLAARAERRACTSTQPVAATTGSQRWRTRSARALGATAASMVAGVDPRGRGVFLVGAACSPLRRARLFRPSFAAFLGVLTFSADGGAWLDTDSAAGGLVPKIAEGRNPMEELGVVYEARDWPHGLMCAVCPRVFREGDRYSERLYAFAGNAPIVEILCLSCATAEAPERQAPRA